MEGGVPILAAKARLTTRGYPYEQNKWTFWVLVESLHGKRAGT